MELTTAVELIKEGVQQENEPKEWADIGAGHGLFTMALATLLKKGSMIYAIDKDKSALDSIQLPDDNIHVQRIHQNFEKFHTPNPIDGAVMANSLHYVKHKAAYLNSVSSNLRPGGHLIVIEYDTDKSNTWVPYPIRYQNLADVLAHPFQLIGKIGEVPSAFRRGNIYSALIRKEI